MNEQKESENEKPQEENEEQIITDETEIPITDEKYPTPKWRNISIFLLSVGFGLSSLTLVTVFLFNIIPDNETLVTYIFYSFIGTYTVVILLALIYQYQVYRWGKRNPLRLELTLTINNLVEKECLMFDDIAEVNYGFYIHIKPTEEGFVKSISVDEETKALLDLKKSLNPPPLPTEEKEDDKEPPSE